MSRDWWIGLGAIALIVLLTWYLTACFKADRKYGLGSSPFRPPKPCHGRVKRNKVTRRWDASCDCGWSNGWWPTWSGALKVLEGHLTRTREYKPEDLRQREALFRPTLPPLPPNLPPGDHTLQREGPQWFINGVPFGDPREVSL